MYLSSYEENQAHISICLEVMQTLGLHLFLQGDIKQGRNIRNTGIKSEDEEPASISFSSHFILVSGLKGSFITIVTLFTGILCPNSFSGHV